MAGPQDFMVSAPTLRVDTAPMLKVADILSNAPMNVAKGFEAGSDIALKRALSNPADYTDSSGNIDWSKLIKLGAQKGGIPFLEKLAPYIYTLPGVGDAPNFNDIRSGGRDQSPPQQEAGAEHPAGASHDNIVPRQSSPAGAAMPKITGTGSEFDPYVIPKDANSIKFFAQQQNFPNNSHFKIGDTGYGGVKGEVNKDGNQKIVNLDTGKTMASTAGKAASRGIPDQSQDGSGQQAGNIAASGASGSPAPTGKSINETMAAPLDQTRPSPAQIAQAIPGAVPARGTFPPRTPPPAGQPGPIATPGGGPPLVPSQVPVATPQPQPQPQPAAPPQPVTAPVRQPMKPIDATVGDKTIADLQARQDKLSGDIAEWGRKNGPAKIYQGAIEAATQQINNMQKAIDTRREKLNAPYKETNEALVRGFKTPEEMHAFDEAQKGDVDRGGKIYAAFNAAGLQYLQDKDVLDQADGILNDPTFFSGFGANANMSMNSLLTAMGGDPKAAMLQNAFQKVNATVLLATLNRQKFEMAEAGNTSVGKQFASQIEITKEATPQLNTTVWGNRFLLTMNRRAGDQAVALARLAQDYKIQHGHLGAEFDKQATKYLEDHPVITRQEKDHPELMGAPRIPADMLAANDKQALIRWGQAHHLRPPEPGADRDPKKFQGDPIRLGDEPKYIHMPPITFPSLGEHRRP